MPFANGKALARILPLHWLPEKIESGYDGVAKVEGLGVEVPIVPERTNRCRPSAQFGTHFVQDAMQVSVYLVYAVFRIVEESSSLRGQLPAQHQITLSQGLLARCKVESVL
jgi:hypothetical protein